MKSSLIVDSEEYTLIAHLTISPGSTTPLSGVSHKGGTGGVVEPTDRAGESL